LLLSLASAGIVLAQDQRDEALEKLRQISRESVPRVEQYLDQVKARGLGTDVSEPVRKDLAVFAGHASRYADCMKLVRLEDFAFKTRFDSEMRQQLFSLVDQVAACKVNNLLIPVGEREIGCCEALSEDTLTPSEKELTRPEFSLAADLQRIWRGHSEKLAAETIAEMQRSVTRFRRKLIDGFPGMPWEYVFNIQGDRRGPSPHQIIWAHFDVGMEQTTRVQPGDLRVQPVLGFQALGYNYYFLDNDNWVGRKLKYVGFAGLVTVNGKSSVNTARYGGVFHFGNFVSVGSTYGDRRWRLYLSSNKAFDQILRIWN
jgi:hypothetical protein